MAVANATLVSKKEKLHLGKNPSTIIIEGSATISQKGGREAFVIMMGPSKISRTQEIEAKHDLELERIKNEHKLKVGSNESNCQAQV